jgi:ribose 5-phosphate isomerase B
LKIAIGSDHAGYLLKETIKEYLKDKKDIEFKDYGTFKMDSCNYPEYGYKVSQAISSGEFDLGILICGTGIGMCITANKIKGIRAALVHDKKTAQLSRLHNDANVLCLGGKVVNDEDAAEIVDTWLNTSFEGGRHQKRISILSKLTGL